MAEVGPETSPSPFHIEAIILAKEESTTSEKRLHARFLKDVKIKERDSKQPMVARPVWPYEYWRTNNTDSSTWDFNPQTQRSVPLNATSENQASQKGDWDHFSLLETKQNELNPATYEANTAKESSPEHSSDGMNTSFAGECEVPLAAEESETEQSSEGGNAKEDLDTLDCINKDTCINEEVRSEETLVETKIPLKGKGVDDSKERQPTIVESEQDTGDRYMNKTLKCDREINTP